MDSSALVPTVELLPRLGRTGNEILSKQQFHKMNRSLQFTSRFAQCRWASSDSMLVQVRKYHQAPSVARLGLSDVCPKRNAASQPCASSSVCRSKVQPVHGLPSQQLQRRPFYTSKILSAAAPDPDSNAKSKVAQAVQQVKVRLRVLASAQRR